MWISKPGRRKPGTVPVSKPRSDPARRPPPDGSPGVSAAAAPLILPCELRNTGHSRGSTGPALVLLGWSLLASGPAQAGVQEGGPGAASRPSAVAALPSEGRMRAVVIFARFQDEEGPPEAPPWAADLFDPDLPGSLTHYFHEMSHGQFRLEGEALARVYTSASPASAYLSGGEGGFFGNFTREILTAAAADPGVDFRRFDSDGPDGVPDSGDDDGYVDLALLVLQSTPSGFIRGDANGVASLGLLTPFHTSDFGRSGISIRIRADSGLGGSLQRGRTFGEAVGIAAHEIGHLLGLPDLYDLDATSFGDEFDLEGHSAGIGYWGVMSHGLRGWNESLGGPTPFCAWSLRRLGWLGVNNERLVTVTGSMDGAPLIDANRGGKVYQMDVGVDEYLLVEHRSAGGSHYDRDLPASGVLIWHIRERGSNDVERSKLVDLVCADGRYTDAGYPLGVQPSPWHGLDNLDYWSRDSGYSAEHAGNLGDATDPFDGVRFTELSPVSNPALNRVNVNRIRRTAEGFAADLTVEDPRRAGPIGEAVWRDTIEIVGDVRVVAGSELHVEAGTVVLVGPDGLRSGDDPGRGEIVFDGAVTTSSPVLFTAATPEPAPGDWGGIRVSATARVRLDGAVIEHATDGLTIQGASRDQQLWQVTVRQAAGAGVVIEDVDGRVRLHGVEVAGAGGEGIVIRGGGPVEADAMSVRDCAGYGIVREGGALFLTGSDLRANGEDAGGADLLMADGAWGTLEGNRFSGEGTGVHFRNTGLVVMEGNALSRYRLAARASSAAPRILRNRFVQVDTVLVVEGFPVPGSMLLNSVVEPAVLVVNTTPHRIDAKRNWWGTEVAGEIQAGMSGPVDWTPFLNHDPRLPVEFALAQSYPNPFSDETVIEFSVPPLPASLGISGPMTLEVRTLLGGLVRRLLHQEAAPGVYQVVWDGRDESGIAAASGLYYYQFSVGGLYLRRRLVVLR